MPAGQDDDDRKLFRHADAQASGRIPVLWISGPSGVGKSTVSWQLYTELTESGVPVAFADTDQLGMCSSAPAADPGGQRIKAQNVGAMLSNYRGAGARCVIVNGFVDPALGIPTDLLSQASLTICRLRADLDEVIRRLAGRHESSDYQAELIREVRDEAAGLDASEFADACIDTDGVPAAEVARLVRQSCPDWPGFGDAIRQPRATAAHSSRGAGGGAAPDHGAYTADGHILLVCGPTGVGKSAIGFQVCVTGLQAGLTTGYVDLDQIGFITPALDDDPGNHRLKASNLAAIWRNYHALGARHLVAVGPVESEAALRAYVEALPAATITLCRLHASRAELTRRIMTRQGGGGWPQPGDPLRGRPAEYLYRVADRAAADADTLERDGIGVRVDTDGRSVNEAADLVAAATGWPRQAS
jgi:predicted ABC-type ATPase